MLINILFTECKTTQLADIVFLVDSSNSVGSSNFKKQMDFIVDLLDGFAVSHDKVIIFCSCMFPFFSWNVVWG